MLKIIVRFFCRCPIPTPIILELFRFRPTKRLVVVAKSLLLEVRVVVVKGGAALYV